MFPQMRHIQRFVVDGQSEQVEMDGVAAFANGMVRERDVVGWEDSNVWEYRQTGHL